MAGELTKRRRANRGLTLVELLVVLAIVALIASVIALNAPAPANDARTEADRFAARLKAASQQAIMTGTVIGLDLNQADYRFYTYHRGDWSLADAAELHADQFPDGVSVSIDIAGAPKTEERQEKVADEAPDIFFSPTGETTPMKVELRSKRRLWIVEMDAGGAIQVIRDDA